MQFQGNMYGETHYVIWKETFQVFFSPFLLNDWYYLIKKRETVVLQVNACNLRSTFDSK